MATIEYVYKRLTHKYVGTCKGLDDWGNDPITVKVLGGKFLDPYQINKREGREEEYIDPSVGGTSYNRVVIMDPRNLPDEEVRDALYQHFSQHGCHHEYDCCGCQSVGVDLVKKSKREWLMTSSYSYNF